MNSREYFTGSAYLGGVPAFSESARRVEHQVDQLDVRFGRRIVGFARGILGTLSGETWKLDVSKGFPVLKERPVNPWEPKASIDTTFPCGLMTSDLEDSQLPAHMTEQTHEPSCAPVPNEMAAKSVSQVVYRPPMSKTA